ncbi:MAG: hypothetical protein IPK28_11550 [Devosia sp.]|nr:hypothetical protein [Devosia sp.]
MMKVLLAGLALWAGMSPALALECPLAHAIYGQPEGPWEMRFQPLPQTAAANQILAFSVSVPEDAARLEGGVYIPNGFGSALGSIGLDCADDFDTDCRFWEGTVYALVGDGIAELPHEPDQMAPRQILLPQFAVGVWYSTLREAGFTETGTLLDVFTLAACAK